MPITPFPDDLPNRNQSPADFQANTDSLLGHLPTFVEEANEQAEDLNALEARLTALQPGGAASILLTFDTATSDADPGAGKVRLNQAVQNTSTQLFADLADKNGVDITSLLDSLDDSDSAVKGHIRLVNANDGTKWLLFSLSALASPVGYRKLTVALVSASSASPFVNGDVVAAIFSRTGDKGATGNTGPKGDNGLSGGMLARVVAGSGNFTAGVNTHYDITAAADMTMPAAPSDGDRVGGTKLTTGTTRVISSKPIRNQPAGTFPIETNGFGFVLEFDATLDKWI